MGVTIISAACIPLTSVLIISEKVKLVQSPPKDCHGQESLSHKSRNHPESAFAIRKSSFQDSAIALRWLAVSGPKMLVYIKNAKYRVFNCCSCVSELHIHDIALTLTHSRDENSSDWPGLTTLNQKARV